MGVMARPLTEVVEKYAKWQPALPSLYFFIVNVLWSSLSTPLTNAINAIGKIKITLKLMMMWTSLTWILTIPLVIKYGFIGVSIAAALVSCTSIVTIIIAKKLIGISVIANVGWQFVASCIMGSVLYFFKDFTSASLGRFILGIIGGMGLYGLTIFLLMPKKLLFETNKVVHIRNT